MVDTVDELASLSRKLNQNSNVLNNSIVTINDKLAKLKLGVEAWLLDSPIHVGDPYFNPDDDEQRFPMRSELVLGFCKTDDAWQLATKDITTGTDAFGRQFADIIEGGRPQALLESPRNVRIQAMDLVPDLLDALKAEAEKLLSSIEKAKEAADKL
jgi:hypothetical protein